MVSRKKSLKTSKPKRVSTKKAAKNTKSKNRSGNSKTTDKQPQSSNTSGVTKRGKKSWGKPFPKGVSGNPKGRPKLGSTKLDNLLRAVRNVEQKIGANLLEHFIERGFVSDSVLSAVMKKLYPDLKSIEQVTLAADSMTEKEASDIRKEMAKRFRTK